MGNFYIVTLKFSSNLGNCDLAVTSDPNEIFFVVKTTDLTLSNLKPLMTNFKGQSSYNFLFLILECPDPCECDFSYQTIISVNCGGKELNSMPWKFPLAMSKL